MLTKSEFAALIAGANNGVLLLALTVVVGLILAVALGRLFHVRIALPSPRFPITWGVDGDYSGQRVLFTFRMEALTAILILGAILRLITLFTPPWYDETFTARIAGLPLDALPAAIAGDVHPPLFYLLDWALVHLFGANALGLRLVPALFGVLTILVVYRLARLVDLSERGALWAALITAVLPSLLYYSVEARGYSLLAYLVVYALAALWSDQRKSFAVALSLIPLTHNLGYVYALVLGLIALWAYERAYLKPLVYASILPLLWLPSLLAQARDVSDGFWLGTLEAITPGMVTRTLFDSVMTTKLNTAAVVPAYALALALTLFALWYGRVWLRRFWPLLAVAFGVPALVLGVSLVWHDVFLGRALLPCTALLVIVWARLVETHRRALYGLVPLLLIGLAGYFTHGYETPDLAPVFEPCLGRQIYATDVPSAMFAGSYLPGQEISLWPDAGDLNQSLSHSAQLAMNFWPRALSRLAGPVCVVSFDTPLSSDAEKAFLTEIAQRAERHHTAVNVTWHINVYTLEQ